MASSQHDLAQLKYAWRYKELVIFLGAGMSLPYGIPSWRDLVFQLLLDADSEYKYFWPEYRLALADWMRKHFEFDLLALSRVVKTMIKERKKKPTEQALQFAQEVRKRLYPDNLSKPGGHSALATLAKLMQPAWKQGRGPCAIVSMNFDDLFEQELSHFGVPFTPVLHEGCIVTESLPILHPHGYLPQRGKIDHPFLVFSEDEYHQLAHTPFHWGVAEMLTFLRRFTVLFIGLSMADPTLRRLLDATAQAKSSVAPTQRRFVIRRNYTVPTGQTFEQAIDSIEAIAAGSPIRSALRSPSILVRYDQRRFVGDWHGLLF